MEPKKYPSADIHSIRVLLFLTSLAISLLLVIAAFELRVADKTSRVINLVEFQLAEIIQEPPVTEQPPPAPPQINQLKLVEVTNETIIEETQAILDQEVMSEITFETTPIDSALETEEADEIFLIVESPPEFIGGHIEFTKYLRKNLKYPERASRMGIEGRVFVTALIEKDGMISNVELLKGIGGGCDEEALRVIKSMPTWNPGKQRGKPVRVRVTMPITFALR